MQDEQSPTAPELPIGSRSECAPTEGGAGKSGSKKGRGARCRHLTTVLTCLTLLLAFAVRRLGLPPLRTFPDRTVPIHESLVRIDNENPYDSEDKWGPNGTVAGLHAMNPYRVAFFDEAIRANLKGPYRVVDLGCGGGLVSNALARHEGYSKIVGVDLSQGGLAYARARAVSPTLPEFVLASMYETGLEDSSFDVVIMSDVLEHLTDLPAMMKEVYRLLRPGGLFLFDTIDRSHLSYFIAIFGAEYFTGVVPKGSHDWGLFIRPSELGQLLERANFKDYEFHALEPSFLTVLNLWAFGWGFLSVEHMRGVWSLEAPTGSLVHYIGHALKPEA